MKNKKKTILQKINLDLLITVFIFFLNKKKDSYLALKNPQNDSLIYFYMYIVYDNKCILILHIQTRF